jgi:hypothetical protein
MVSGFRRLLVALVVLLWQGTFLWAQDEGPQFQGPAFQFVLAAFSLIIIMVILCMPSRKRQNEKKI